MLSNSKAYQYKLTCYDEVVELIFAIDSSSDIQDFLIFEGSDYIIHFEDKKPLHKIASYNTSKISTI